MRTLVIGLDCAAPELVFGRYREHMPHVARLMAQGAFGRLRSTLPPITVPAWASMFSGRDPGELGLYGFRKRERGSYAMTLASSDDLHVPMLWDRASAAGKRVAVLFVPPSFPPRAVNGQLVSCFLTPDAECEHTHPPQLADELSARFGAYVPDVDEYRTDARDALLAELYALSTQHFAIAEHLLLTQKPDFTVLVDIGLDRFHHAFWSNIDIDDPRHEPSNPHADAGRAYYAFLDTLIGKLLRAAGDDCAVLVVSDHGAKPLRGGICINEWLIARGYLVLHEYPKEITTIDRANVDWTRTRVWAEGGYYARVFLNVQGREPGGILPESYIASFCDSLKHEIAEIPGPNGEKLAHRIVTPQESYRRCEGLPPDLAVFFGDLDYRALGSVGHRSLHVPHNDTGPDACNHDWDGIFVMHVPGMSALGELSGLHIYDVNATLLGLMGLTTTDDLLGRDLLRTQDGPA